MSVVKGHALSESRRCCIYACRMAESWNVVRVCRERESPVAEVRRNADILLYQTDPDKAVLQHMKDYLHCISRQKGDGKKLVGALAAEKLLLYAPLLCLVCGTRPSKLFDYQMTKLFT